MIPQNRHMTTRWEVRFILTAALFGLLLLLNDESSTILASAFIGYLVTLIAFDYWLHEAIDEGQ